jgi:hypothetical protein
VSLVQVTDPGLLDLRSQIAYFVPKHLLIGTDGILVGDERLDTVLDLRVLFIAPFVRYLKFIAAYRDLHAD